MDCSVDIKSKRCPANQKIRRKSMNSAEADICVPVFFLFIAYKYQSFDIGLEIVTTVLQWLATFLKKMRDRKKNLVENLSLLNIGVAEVFKLSLLSCVICHCHCRHCQLLHAKLKSWSDSARVPLSSLSLVYMTFCYFVNEFISSPASWFSLLSNFFFSTFIPFERAANKCHSGHVNWYTLPWSI